MTDSNNPIYQITVDAGEVPDIDLADELSEDGEGDCELSLCVQGEEVNRLRGNLDDCIAAMRRLQEVGLAKYQE